MLEVAQSGKERVWEREKTMISYAKVQSDERTLF